MLSVKLKFESMFFYNKSYTELEIFFHDILKSTIESGRKLGMSLKTIFKRKLVTSIAVGMLALSAFAPVSQAKVKTADFTDVSTNYLEAVDYLVVNQFSNGVTSTKFGTELEITRGSVAVILANALGLTNTKAPDAGFTDVPSRAKAAVNSLKQAGIINGKSATRFGFEDSLKRGEFALMMTKSAAYALKGDTESIQFPDVNPNYSEAVAGMVEHNITNGKSAKRFGTNDPLKRGELAVFIYKAEMLKWNSGFPEAYDELSQMLHKKEVSSIKLIGDSITAGMGVEGYTVPQDNRVIFDNGKGRVHREAIYTTGVWANQLRNYTKNPAFGELDFINAGISGISAEWLLDNIDYLTKKEDVVFVMIGTNDRRNSDLQTYEANVRKLLEIVDARSNYMVVMSPPPSINHDYHRFSPKDIDIVLKKISKEKGYPFISHYDAIHDYLANHKEYAFEDLMEPNSPHPIEAGYEVMWQKMKEKLSFK